MCKTVDKIEELKSIARNMAYELGYKSKDMSWGDNQWPAESDCGSLWDLGRRDADCGDESMTRAWRP